MNERISRVFVTGLGAVSAAGIGAEALWGACLAGRSIVRPIPEHWDTYYRSSSRVWSPLPELNYPSYGISRTDTLTLPVPALLSLVAATEAMAQAGLITSSATSAIRDGDGGLRRGVFVGTGLGAARAPFDNYYAHVISGMRAGLQSLADADHDDPVYAERVAALKAHPRVSPLVICQTMPNASAAQLAIQFGIRGCAETNCSACAAGTVAIGKAFDAVRYRRLDVALAGGAEHLADRSGCVFMGFDRLQTLARPLAEIGSENRPFDRQRSGFLFSEGGAAFAVLESEHSVMMRGVKPIAEIVGYGESVDARSVAAIRPDDNAIAPMFKAALTDARLDASRIDYINAHGTGTQLNDEVEAQQIAAVFGTRVRVNSTKSILGHTIGAAGALEFVVTALSLARQQIHASLNLVEPIAPLNFCTETEAAKLEYALTHSFGFGGHNAGLVLRRPPD